MEDAGDVCDYGDGDYWVLYFVFGYAVEEYMIPDLQAYIYDLIFNGSI